MENLTRGSGVATAQGLGASLSGLAAGVIVDHFGYAAGFLTSACVAALAFLALALAMPETAAASNAVAPGELALTSVPAWPAKDDGG